MAVRRLQCQVTYRKEVVVLFLSLTRSVFLFHSSAFSPRLPRFITSQMNSFSPLFSRFAGEFVCQTAESQHGVSKTSRRQFVQITSGDELLNSKAVALNE